jgi:hypothetical protein
LEEKMSTVAYAQLTNKREESPPKTSSTTSSPGIKSYIDAFAALVPAEVLTLHALIIAATTKTATTAPVTVGAAPAASAAAATNNASLGTTTTILPDAVQALTISFWVLLVLSIALFVIPRYSGGKWDKFDWVRASIAPLAFVGWTMLQRATAFDAAFPGVGQVNRTVYALILGAVLGGVTAALASKADAKPPQNGA